MSGVPLLRVEDLQIHFAGRGRDMVKAVDGIDFEVHAGETFGVIGESGSGKTTLGRALVSLLEPSAGRVLHDGIDPRTLRGAALRAHRRRWQIVFQDPNASLNPRMTILDSVAEPLDIAGGDRRANRRAALESLARVGLAPELAARYPHQLSGGQKQRANIARVLTLAPRLIVCDEVVAALDVSIRGDVLNLFADLQREHGLTYVFITHDLSVVSHISDRIAVAYLGRLMELGPADGLTGQPLHPYTEALLSAEPVPLPAALRTGQRIVLQGEIPSPVDPPSGCRFRTRCRYVQPRCAQAVPSWRELRPGHRVACHFATPDGPPTVVTVDDDAAVAARGDPIRPPLPAPRRSETTMPDRPHEPRLPAGAPSSRRDLLQAALGAAAASVLPGGAHAQAASPRRGGVLKVAAPANPSSLDPATGGAGSDHVFLWTIFDTLVDWDYATLKPVPGMAEWATPDANTFVLTIRPGITFHDGTPMDAAAVKFNLDRNRSDARSNIKADLVNISAVDVTGPLQVRLTLKQPDAALPAILSDRAGMMASPKAVQALGNQHDRQPVGAGRWKFVSWADNQKIVVTRHEQYWRAGQPQLDGIELSIIPEMATGLRSVVAGQNHLAYGLSARYTPIASRAKNVTVVNGPTLYCYKIYFNYARGPLANAKVRQAINFALNRQTFINATMGGAGEPAFMLLPSSHWGYDKAVADLYRHDPDRARKLLAEAGFGSGLELTFGGYSDQDSVRRSEVIMDQLGKVGIRCKFTNGTIPEISGQFFGNEKKFDALVSAWTGRPDPSMTYALAYGKGAYYNAGRAEASPELSQMLLDSRAKEDLAWRKQVFARLQRIVMEQALSAPIAFQLEMDAVGNEVKGFRPNLLGKPKFWDVALGA